jgi:hypothetical protein
MAQCGAGKHDQWGGYMTFLAVNHGIIKSISIPTAVILPKMKFDVDSPQDCFYQEVKWMVAIFDSLSVGFRSCTLPSTCSATGK